MYLNTRNPGRVHDAACFDHSALAHALANHPPLIENGVLLGDTGYGNTQNLVTPLLGDNLTPAQIEYNRAHKKSRAVIEQCFGLAKERFRILKFVNYEPEFAAQIVQCAFLLHNIALRSVVFYVEHKGKLATVDFYISECNRLCQTKSLPRRCKSTSDSKKLRMDLLIRVDDVNLLRILVI